MCGETCAAYARRIINKVKNGGSFRAYFFSYVCHKVSSFHALDEISRKKSHKLSYFSFCVFSQLLQMEKYFHYLIVVFFNDIALILNRMEIEYWRKCAQHFDFKLVRFFFKSEHFFKVSHGIRSQFTSIKQHWRTCYNLISIEFIDVL